MNLDLFETIAIMAAFQFYIFIEIFLAMDRAAS
jgi:hypothetical protein